MDELVKIDDSLKRQQAADATEEVVDTKVLFFPALLDFQPVILPLDVSISWSKQLLRFCNAHDIDPQRCDILRQAMRQLVTWRDDTNAVFCQHSSMVEQTLPAFMMVKNILMPVIKKSQQSTGSVVVSTQYQWAQDAAHNVASDLCLFLQQHRPEDSDSDAKETCTRSLNAAFEQTFAWIHELPSCEEPPSKNMEDALAERVHAVEEMIASIKLENSNQDEKADETNDQEETNTADENEQIEGGSQNAVDETREEAPQDATDVDDVQKEILEELTEMPVKQEPMDPVEQITADEQSEEEATESAAEQETVDSVDTAEATAATIEESEVQESDVSSASTQEQDDFSAQDVTADDEEPNVEQEPTADQTDDITEQLQSISENINLEEMGAERDRVDEVERAEETTVKQHEEMAELQQSVVKEEDEELVKEANEVANQVESDQREALEHAAVRSSDIRVMVEPVSRQSIAWLLPPLTCPWEMASIIQILALREDIMVIHPINVIESDAASSTQPNETNAVHDAVGTMTDVAKITIENDLGQDWEQAAGASSSPAPLQTMTTASEFSIVHEPTDQHESVEHPPETWRILLTFALLLLVFYLSLDLMALGVSHIKDLKAWCARQLDAFITKLQPTHVQQQPASPRRPAVTTRETIAHPLSEPSRLLNPLVYERHVRILQNLLTSYAKRVLRSAIQLWLERLVDAMAPPPPIVESTPVPSLSITGPKSSRSFQNLVHLDQQSEVKRQWSFSCLAMALTLGSHSAHYHQITTKTVLQDKHRAFNRQVLQALAPYANATATETIAARRIQSAWRQRRRQRMPSSVVSATKEIKRSIQQRRELGRRRALQATQQQHTETVESLRRHSLPRADEAQQTTTA